MLQRRARSSCRLSRVCWRANLTGGTSQTADQTHIARQKALVDAEFYREQKLAEAKAETAAAFDAGKAELEKHSLETRTALGKEAEDLADRIAAGILK